MSANYLYIGFVLSIGLIMISALLYTITLELSRHNRLLEKIIDVLKEKV